MNDSLVSPLATLLARVSIGFLFLAHGLQKLLDWGVQGTADSFAQMGVPVAGLSAFAVTWLETLGGLALLVGLLTPLVSGLLVVDMIGAIILVHGGNGIFVSDGGFELVLALGAGALLFTVAGPGRYSVDHLLRHVLPWSTSRTRETSEA